MTGLSEERLTQIRARAEAATAGPWRARYTATVCSSSVEVTKTPTVWKYHLDTIENEDIPCYDVVGMSQRQNDAEFVSHARQDIPDLLDEIHRLREENKSLRRMNDVAYDGGVEDAGELARALRQRIDNALAALDRHRRINDRGHYSVDGHICGCPEDLPEEYFCWASGNEDRACCIGDSLRAALTGQDPT